MVLARNNSIDVLRAVAIFLVLGRHAHWPENSIASIWQRGGWVGVDLFFVLSGFLVSGLLLKQFKETGAISWTNFVVRRGFKIYPAFWCLIIFSLIFNAITHAAPFESFRLLSELAFVQNYGQPMWGHTWSLAVEEHFYLLLPLILMICTKNQFKYFPLFVSFIAGACLAMRLTGGEWNVQRNMFATHLRLDSLLFGSFLSYLYHYQQDFFHRVASYKKTLPITGIALLLPAFIWKLEESRAIYTFGFTLFYIGSGAILMAFVGGLRENRLTHFLGMIGRYSYSIYLWHAAIVEWCHHFSTVNPQRTKHACAAAPFKNSKNARDST
jgi:peptidoglycan/LPS O-acetylase OafA/YrhL